MRLFKLSFWSKMKATDPDSPDYIDSRRNVLFAQITLIGLITCFALGFYDLIGGALIPAIIDVVFGAGLVGIYMLNEKGRHNLAKFIFIPFISLAIFGYTAVSPLYSGLILYYTSIIVTIFILLPEDQRVPRNIFIGMNVILLVVLTVTDLQVFGPVDVFHNDVYYRFIVNLIVVIFVVVFEVQFLLSANAFALTYIRNQKEKLEKVNAELDQFVYRASHDMRAPLRSVLGIVNLARIEPQKTEQYLNMIEQSIHHLDSFIAEITDHTRNSKTELKPEAVDFDELLDHIFDQMKFITHQRVIELRKKMKVQVIRCDKERLRIIMSNLLSNAIKYNDSTKASYVEVGVEEREGNICISVADNGIGIENFHHSHIYDMFYRAHDRSKGSGLGLYIVKEVVEKMGGQIHLDSQVGVGTTFNIIFPAA